MITVKKGILEGMNGDDSLKMVGDKAAINIMNAGVSISQTGRNLRLENRKGTTAVSQSVHPSGTNICLGSAIDLPRNRIIYALHNSNGNHGFYCYDTILDVTREVLLQSQANLDFDKAFRIDRNMKVIGDLLYYTDNNNDLRRFNVEAAIKMNDSAYVTDVEPYTAPLNDNVIALIRNPPQLCPTFLKATNSITSSNFIENQAFYFSARYIYRDGEISVLSPKSELGNYNYEGDTYNCYVVTFGNVLIDQDVSQVDLVVQRGQFGKSFVVKSWKRSVAADLAAINLHNAGSLLYTIFYNDSEGTPLDNAYSVKLADAVPLKSKTLEFANNRLMPGNNLVGYDTPIKTSLTATAVDYTSYRTRASIPLYSVQVKLTKTANPDTYIYLFYVLMDGQQWIVGVPTIQTGTPPSPTTPTSPISFLTMYNYDDNVVEAQTASYLLSGWAIDTNVTTLLTTVTIGDTGAYITYGGRDGYGGSQNTFKSGDAYDVSIQFYDYYMRPFGVYETPIIVPIPTRTDFTTKKFDLIRYTLNNADAINEIPVEAYYYSIDRSIAKRKKFFVQGAIFGVSTFRYVSKDPLGNYVYNLTFTSNTFATAILATKNITNGIGYVFNENDICEVIANGTITSLEVLGVDGEYILVNPYNFVSASGNIFYEIYTPNLVGDGYFYEVGKIFRVKNAGTAGREYVSTDWLLNGDTYYPIQNRANVTSYLQAMSPNDKYWQFWNNGIGRVAIMLPIGQRRKPLDIAWSNVYLQGTQNNGLSTFDGLDTKQLPNENGEIQKLQLATKIGEQGGVLLAICAKSTVSMYLGQAQLLAASQNGFIATSDGVIGSINVLKQAYGTINPESVVEYFGLIFWYDVNNGVWVQYSVNGLDVVSKYKMQRYFANYAADYRQTTTADIETINGFSHIPSGIDPYYRELIAVSPGLIDEVDADILPSYNGVPPSYATSIINRFDVYDKLAKTLSFKFDSNIWSNNWEFAGEWYDYVSNDMYGFKGCVLYKHNSDAVHWNRFYGNDVPIRVCVSLNEPFSMDRELINTAIEGSHAATFTVAYSDNPNIQITDLSGLPNSVSDNGDYIKEGTVFFATFYKDRLSPNQTGEPDVRLFKGDYITGYPILLMYEFDVNEELVHIDCFDIGFAASKGLKQIVLK